MCCVTRTPGDSSESGHQALGRDARWSGDAGRQPDPQVATKGGSQDVEARIWIGEGRQDRVRVSAAGSATRRSAGHSTIGGAPPSSSTSAAEGFAGPGSVVTAGQAGAFSQRGKGAASPADSSPDRGIAVYEEAHRWRSAWAGLGQDGPRRQQRAAPPARARTIRPAVPSRRFVDASPAFLRPRVAPASLLGGRLEVMSVVYWY